MHRVLVAVVAVAGSTAVALLVTAQGGWVSILVAIAVGWMLLSVLVGLWLGPIMRDPSEGDTESPLAAADAVHFALWGAAREGVPPGMYSRLTVTSRRVSGVRAKG